LQINEKDTTKKKRKEALLHIQGIDNEMLEQKKRLIIVGGSKGNVQSECMCALPLGILSLYYVNN
jgi:hypothetical protein